MYRNSISDRFEKILHGNRLKHTRTHMHTHTYTLSHTHTYQKHCYILL